MEQFEMYQLISALVDRQAITKDNVITASYTVKDGSGRPVRRIGEFGIVNFEKIDDTISFTLQHIIDKNQVKVIDGNILAIDGMDPERYADVYDIKSDGTDKKIGKKRGRKPKTR
jgi:hypothetical protein